MLTKFLSLIICLLFVATTVSAQKYTDSIRVHRAHYKQEFITDKNSPLQADDTAFLRFYAPNKFYRISAKVALTKDPHPFKMETHSGKIRMYQKYAELHFVLQKKKLTLEIYQSLDLMKNEAYKEHLFIPFNDLTNYETTYAGGRYIDLSIKDIHNGVVWLDFNKCYNPYCAYASGYSCPIPPEANRLSIRIEAGEKIFGKEVKE